MAYSDFLLIPCIGIFKFEFFLLGLFGAMGVNFKVFLKKFTIIVTLMLLSIFLIIEDNYKLLYSCKALTILSQYI